MFAKRLLSKEVCKTYGENRVYVEKPVEWLKAKKMKRPESALEKTQANRLLEETDPYQNLSRIEKGRETMFKVSDIHLAQQSCVEMQSDDQPDTLEITR